MVVGSRYRSTVLFHSTISPGGEAWCNKEVPITELPLIASRFGGIKKCFVSSTLPYWSHQSIVILLAPVEKLTQFV